MPPTRLSRNKSLPLLRSFRQFLVPCLLMVVILVFGTVKRKVLSKSAGGNEQIVAGKIVNSTKIATQRKYIRYTIAGADDPRYWLSSIAKRFRVAGGWPKIAELTLKLGGKQATDKEIWDSQYQLKIDQKVFIPL